MIIAHSLKEARELGLEFYQRTLPCKHGNVAPRCIKTNKCKCVMCTDEVKANDRKKYWRHREEKIAYQSRLYAVKKEEILQRNREYRLRNREALCEKDREWYALNSEVDNERRRIHYNQNKGNTLVRIAAWYLKNRQEIIKKNTNLTRLRELRIPVWFAELDELVIAEAHDLCDLRFSATALPWEVDHMLPMRSKTVSGLHCWNNIQVIPHAMNRAKRSRLLLTEPGQWISGL